VGQVIPRLIEILEEKGLLENATYVSYGTTERETIIEDLKAINTDNCDYFSMVMISIRRRKGILKGLEGDKKVWSKDEKNMPSTL
jgi:precorrin-2/cobalt-factor-2 C20-methyltransferase